MVGASTGEGSGLVLGKGSASTGEGLGEYRRRVRASTKRVQASARKGSRRVQRKGQDEYWERVRVSVGKGVESG